MATNCATNLAELEHDASWLFDCIASRDVQERSQALQQLEAWIKEASVENTENGILEDADSLDKLSNSSAGESDKGTLYLGILLHVLRLSVQCPFKDVQEKCLNLLQILQDKGVKVPSPCPGGPSAFIPSSEFSADNGTDDPNKKKNILVDVFVQTQRLDHLATVLSLHPSYLEAFQQTQDVMLRRDGPLPYDYRHYIAIMAAARHRCNYIISLQESEFLAQGGDPTWLQGLQHIPQKLQNLYNLVKYMTHQPWLIDEKVIESLLQPPNSWSLSELVQAVLIATHFSSLASVVYGCGINAEIDMEGGYSMESSPQPDTDESISTLSNNNHTPEEVEEAATADVETLVKRMQELKTELSEAEDSQEEKVKKYEKVERQNLELSHPQESDCCAEKTNLSHYIRDTDFHYRDFARRGEETNNLTAFKAQDYSWEEHGFPLVNRFAPDMAPMLDNKLTLLYNLTYNTMAGRTEVDTSLLRRAIWNYIHVLFGIRHDDYDYGVVNMLLDRPLKSYVKRITCFPERTSRADYNSFWKDFNHSEKVHVNLMVLEARMQASLLYVLRAIMQYMK